MKRARCAIGIGASALSLALAGCGGSAKNPATMTKQQAERAYLAAVAPANAAGAALAAKMQAYPGSAPGSQISAVARPVEQRLSALNGKLLGIASAYPPAAADLRALVTAYSPVIRDLRSTTGQHSTNALSWLQRLATDLTKTRTAAAVVRSDLGLPPAKS
jgi:hypothetical protein